MTHVDPVTDTARALLSYLAVETEAPAELLFLFDQELGEPLRYRAETDEQETHVILRQSLFLIHVANRSTARASWSFDTKEKLIRR